MTIEDKAKKMLTDNGLWPEEAQAVLDAAKADKANEAMAGRWNDDEEGYPPQLFAVLWMAIKGAAADWLKANKPMHWARPMFDNKEI